MVSLRMTLWLFLRLSRGRHHALVRGRVRMLDFADPQIIALDEHCPIDAVAGLEPGKFLGILHREGHGHRLHVAHDLLMPDGGELVGWLQPHHFPVDRKALQRRGGFAVVRSCARPKQDGEQ